MFSCESTDRAVESLSCAFSNLTISSDVASSQFLDKERIVTKEYSPFALVYKEKDVSLQKKEESEIKIPQNVNHEDVERVEDIFSYDKCENKNFFGIAIPEDVENVEDSTGQPPPPIICRSLVDALGVTKFYKGARFKAFSTEKEAALFATSMLKNVDDCKKVSEEIESSPTSSKYITPQDMVQLRKCIEKSDEKKFVEMVLRNPKMLIGPKSDSPAVMHEGPRYNALHVAAKFNKFKVCVIVLHLLQNHKFQARLYPNESKDLAEKRIERILDFYLNLPDKTLGDTPLHYASKFGSLECLRILLSHPFCTPDVKNIDGLTAEEIICNRCNPCVRELYEEIKDAFKGLYYVPILRSEKNVGPPLVGKPCTRREFSVSSGSPMFFIRDSEVEKSSLLHEKYSAIVSEPNLLKAFAGPTSREQAFKIYNLLRNPLSPKECHSPSFYPCLFEEKKILQAVRLSDMEKGLERIARLIAEDLEVEWLEYFPAPLHCFVNLHSDEGLKVLEKCLKERLKNSEGYRKLHDPSLDDADEILHLVELHPSPHINPLGHEINAHLYLDYLDQMHEDDIFYTPPTSPVFSPTPPDSPSQDACFLNGSSLSRVDVDAFLAVGNSNIDRLKYPNVYNWFNLVATNLRSTKEDSVYKKDLTPLASVKVPRLKTPDLSSSQGYNKTRVSQNTLSPSLKRRLF